MATYEKNGHDNLSGRMIIVLHLVPGILFAVFFYALSWFLIRRGLTGYLALIISIPVCLVPIEIGVMLLWGVRFYGNRSLSEVIRYRSKGNLIDYVGLPLLLFFIYGILSMAILPISEFSVSNFSAWLPVWTSQEALIRGLINLPPTQRVINLIMAVLFSGFIAPIVEELYFRGFLLPRMGNLGWSAPVVNSLLFAFYHFYFPGNVVGIFLVFLPIAYVVHIKQNWRIGFVVHSMINLWGVYSLFTFLT